MLAALLGLLAVFCLGQDPVPPAAPQQNPAPQNQVSPDRTPKGQAPQNQAGQEQSPESQAPSENDSSSKPPSPNLPKDPVPPKKSPLTAPPQKQVPQNQSMITLDSSETIFSVLTALNACGYDQDLTISDATRSNVRAEVQRNLRDSEEAEAARTELCDFTQNHVASKDPNRNI